MRRLRLLCSSEMKPCVTVHQKPVTTPSISSLQMVVPTSRVNYHYARSTTTSSVLKRRTHCHLSSSQNQHQHQQQQQLFCLSQSAMSRWIMAPLTAAICRYCTKPPTSSSTTTTTTTTSEEQDEQDVEEFLQKEQNESLLGSLTTEELINAEKMPPALQQSEFMVKGTADLIDATSLMSLSEEEESHLAAVLDLIFSEQAVPPYEQFVVIQSLSMFPSFRENPSVKAAVSTMLRGIIPVYVADFIDEVDTSQLSEEQQKHYEAFVLRILSGKCEEKDFVEGLGAIDQNIPQFFTMSSFVVLLQNLENVMLMTRMCHLISEACKEFDPTGKGRIKLAEFKDSLQNVVGAEQAERMLEGVAVDSEGCIFYPQFTQVLQGVNLAPDRGEAVVQRNEEGMGTEEKPEDK